MKYIVQVNGERLTVDLAADGVHIEGESIDAHAGDVEGTPVRVVTLGTEVHRVVVRRHSARGSYTMWIGGFRFEVEALDERTRAIRDLSSATAATAGPAPLVAPMPVMISRVLVEAGDSVHPGQAMVVMEAMKMENELRATSAGTVKRVAVQPGTAVEKGALLVELG